MNDYKLTVGLESMDSYKKAKQDLLQALKSYSKLTPKQKDELLSEFFGAANVIALCNALNQYFR